MTLLLLFASSAIAGFTRFAGAQTASAYDGHRAAAIRVCDAIDPARYESGLLFNPVGYRSFYAQSECVQQAAIRFRDDALCGHVRERRALFWSSWGISPSACRSRVSDGIAHDQAVLRELRGAYEQHGIRLRDFRIELDNNGRDYEALPIVTGDNGHRYDLRLDVRLAPGSAPLTLHQNGYWMTGDSQLRVYLTRTVVRALLPDLAPARRYLVTMTMTLTLPQGDAGAEWSDGFVERIFPQHARTQTLTKTVNFPDVR
jgi:hypothetical protein